MIKGRLSSTSADTPVSLPHGLQTAEPMVGATLASRGKVRRLRTPCKGGTLPTELAAHGCTSIARETEGSRRGTEGLRQLPVATFGVHTRLPTRLNWRAFSSWSSVGMPLLPS